MSKAWLVAVSTYRQRVRSGTFLLLTFGLPVLMVVVGAMTFFMMERQSAITAVGVVYESHQQRMHTEANQSVSVDDTDILVRTYSDVEAARSAREAGEIEGYLVMPAGYAEGESPQLYINGTVSPDLVPALEAYLRRAVAPDAPDWLLDRLVEPAELTYADSTSGAVVSSGPSLILRVLTPMALAVAFGLLVFTSANQMGVAMVREKDERAMEMVLTSLRPIELLSGKVLGMSLLSLTQIGVWLLGATILVLLLLANVVDLQLASIPWRIVAVAIVLGLPAYFLYASLAAGLGIIAGDSQQARQLAGILGFLGLAPFYFVGAILNNPNNGFALALTYFPLTSPMIILARMAFTNVPVWQIGVAVTLSVVSLLFGIWFVARVFRAAMLLYGQSLRPRTIWQSLRTGPTELAADTQ